MTDRQSRSPPPAHDRSSPQRSFEGLVRKLGAAVRRQGSSPTIIPSTSLDFKPSDYKVPPPPSRSLPPGGYSSVSNVRPASSTPSIAADSDASSGRQSSANSYATSRGSVMTGSSVVSHVSRQDAQQHRAQALYSRFGLTMSCESFATGTPEERTTLLTQPPSTEPYQRVQKRARLRMHATCHKCNTLFRTSSTCARCQHRRCRACPRAAPKGVQQLVAYTKASLGSIGEGAASDTDQGPRRVHRPMFDARRISPNLVVDGTAVRSPSAQSDHDMRDEPDSPRTMASILSACCHPPYMVLDADPAYCTVSRQRALLATLEAACEKLCARHGFDVQKLQQLFPLSFQVIAAYVKKEKQQRVYRLPQLRIRHPCPTCGRAILPRNDWDCRFCANGLGLDSFGRINIDGIF